jgi:hypothetical protein
MMERGFLTASRFPSLIRALPLSEISKSLDNYETLGFLTPPDFNRIPDKTDLTSSILNSYYSLLPDQSVSRWRRRILRQIMRQCPD